MKTKIKSKKRIKRKTKTKTKTNTKIKTICPNCFGTKKIKIQCTECNIKKKVIVIDDYNQDDDIQCKTCRDTGFQFMQCKICKQKGYINDKYIKEKYIQRMFVFFLRKYYPNVIFTANGTFKSRKESGSSILDGYTVGIPDIVGLYPKGIYHGFIIEFKSEHGKIRPEQYKIIKKLKYLKFATRVCFDVRSAIKFFQQYNLL
jgi:hypothetical protein